MLTHWLLQILQAFVSALVAALDAVTPAVPDVVGTISARVNTLAGFLADTGVWVPWGTVGPMIGLVGVAFVASFGIRVVRIVASFFTAGGGSAG